MWTLVCLCWDILFFPHFPCPLTCYSESFIPSLNFEPHCCLFRTQSSKELALNEVCLYDIFELLFGQLCFLFLRSSSPCRSYLGICASFIQAICPAHHSWAFILMPWWAGSQHTAGNCYWSVGHTPLLEAGHGGVLVELLQSQSLITFINQTILATFFTVTFGHIYSFYV